MFKYRMSTLTEIRRKALKRGLSKARSPASSKIFVFERRENCEIYRTKSNNKLTFPGICSILFSSFLRRSTNVITWKGCQGGKRWVAWEARESDGSYFQCGFMIFLNILSPNRFARRIIFWISSVPYDFIVFPEFSLIILFSLALALENRKSNLNPQSLVVQSDGNGFSIKRKSLFKYTKRTANELTLILTDKALFMYSSLKINIH